MTWIIAFFVGAFVAAAVYERVQKPKREQAAREARERREAEVARRGWTLEITTGDRRVEYVYSGTTEGVAWRCEMRAWEAGSRMNRTDQQRQFTRWFTDRATVPDGMLVVWPSFGGQPQPQPGPNVPQFVMNLLLQPLLTALGGDARDAEMLQRALPVDTGDPALRANYSLRATDPALMQRFLAAGAREALAEAAPWLAGRSQPHHLVVAAVRARGLHIVLRGWVDDIGIVDRTAALGARLARTLW